MYQPGRHFLQIPGPTNVPDRVLRAMDFPTIDHRSAEFAELALKAIAGLKPIFKTTQDVVIYPGSGSGGWEAALVNTLSPGDKVLMYETGQFATLWKGIADKFDLRSEFLEGDWRSGADPQRIEDRLRADTEREIKAVGVVHNETSTSCVTLINEVRQAIDNAGHPALFMVDSISSLASIDFRHDEWGIDVTIGGSQKGLMLPPGLSFNAISPKAREASKSAKLPRAYWSWDEMLNANTKGFFPYTPATNLLYGLLEAIDLLNEEGLDNVFARHARHGAATREAVRAWGLELLCNNPRHYSETLTAVLMPAGHSADAYRKLVLESYNMALGTGLNKVADKVFRIGHLGDFNDLMLMGTLSGVEMGLIKAGVPHESGGVQAAIDLLASGKAERVAAAE